MTAPPTIRFRPNNEVVWTRGAEFGRCIPSLVDFQIEDYADYYVLVACGGYGCTEHDKRCYGGGALWVRKKRLSHHYRQKIEEILKKYMEDRVNENCEKLIPKKDPGGAPG